jgi:AcrR family transcriptional regulator
VARARATDTSALVTAAALVFHTKGYHNATIDDIAEAAGISRPTVYKYTRSKQHLLDLMVEQITAEMGRGIQAVLDSTEDPVERLRRLVRTHVDTAVANRTFYAIVLTEELEVSEAGRLRFREWARGVTREFERLIADCLAVHPSPPPVNTFITANLVLSMLTSLYRWYDPDGPVGPSGLTDEILNTLGALVP